MEEGATVSNQKTVYQTYVIRFPLRTDLGDEPYLLRDSGQGGYRSFVDVETLLGALQKELTPASRERDKGFLHIFSLVSRIICHPGLSQNGGARTLETA
jgi:hypothetical protein